jgi:hypothetical protein
LTGDNKTGVISHDFTWASSSGELADLSDVLTREEVVFDRPPGTFMPAYDVFAAMDQRTSIEGNTLTKVGSVGSQGRGHDDHSPGYGPFFDNETGFVKAESELKAKQNYQYQDPETKEWHNIPESEFSIDRKIEKKGFGLWKSWKLTTTKSGQGSQASAGTKLYDSQADYQKK